MVNTSGKSMDQLGMGANTARGQLKRDKHFFPRPRSRLRIWSRQTDSAVPSRVSLLSLHTQAESGAYSRDSSRFPRISATAIRPVSSLLPYIGSIKCVPMAFTAESPLAQDH